MANPSVMLVYRAADLRPQFVGLRIKFPRRTHADRVTDDTASTRSTRQVSTVVRTLHDRWPPTRSVNIDALPSSDRSGYNGEVFVSTLSKRQTVQVGGGFITRSEDIV